MVIFNLCQFNSFQIQLVLELDTDYASTFCLSKYLTIFLSMQNCFLASEGCGIILMNVNTLMKLLWLFSPVSAI